MANRIYVSIIGTDITFSSICTEDISVQAQSQFTRIGDLVPDIQTLATLLNTGGALLNGEVSLGMATVSNALDVPLWNKTEPVKVTTDLNFFVKTSGFNDVWQPTMILQSMNILSRGDADMGGNATLITPGLNIRTIGEVNKSELFKNQTTTLNQDLLRYESSEFASSVGNQGNIPTNKSFSIDSKLCSVYIPGIVYLPMAIVEVAQPTWSKQKTDGGFPLWSKVNVQFTGLFPAVFEDNFLNINPNTIGDIGQV